MQTYTLQKCKYSNFQKIRSIYSSEIPHQWKLLSEIDRYIHERLAFILCRRNMEAVCPQRSPFTQSERMFRVITVKPSLG
jgi:hypothetical protein